MTAQPKKPTPKTRRPALRAAFVVTISVVAAGSATTACGGRIEGVGASSSGGSSSGTTNPPEPQPPIVNPPYPGCGDFAPCEPPEPPTKPPVPPSGVCPYPKPAAGSACADPNRECSYGDNPSCPSAMLTCDPKTYRWIEEPVPSCNPPPPPPPSCPYPKPAIGSSCAAFAAECSYGGTPDCPDELYYCQPDTKTWASRPIGCQ